MAFQAATARPKLQAELVIEKFATEPIDGLSRRIMFGARAKEMAERTQEEDPHGEERRSAARLEP